MHIGTIIKARKPMVKGNVHRIPADLSVFSFWRSVRFLFLFIFTPPGNKQVLQGFRLAVLVMIPVKDRLSGHDLIALFEQLFRGILGSDLTVKDLVYKLITIVVYFVCAIGDSRAYG